MPPIGGGMGRGYLTEEENCRKVTIGIGYQDADVSAYKDTEAIALPRHYNNGYSDARSQVLLAENKDAKPLDKTQESKRFVRDVCFLDYDAMDKISAKCFPDSDATLQEAGEKLTGLVLVDEFKGVVGYCLYDKDERYISDMAVLPEYRTDKNASSRRLMAEMIKRVKEIGGEWKAELRDKTSLRYMKAMQERGIVDMQVGELDHEMDDGSKVYSVTFKVNEQRNKQQDKQATMLPPRNEHSM
jgi:ribosomal protein S18 acetylase RimI-like enzyme